MRMEIFVSLEGRDGVGDDVVDFLQLIAVCFGIQEDGSVGEAVQLPEDNVERSEVVESLLQDVVGLLEEGRVDKGKTEVDVGLPSHKSRVKLLPQGLDLLIVVFNSKGQSCVGDQFDVLYCLHRSLKILIYSFSFIETDIKELP